MSAPPRLLTLGLIAVSLVLLVPGVTQPFFTLTGNLDKAKIADTAIDIIVETMVGQKDPAPTGPELEAAETQARTTVKGMMAMVGIQNPTGEIEAYRKTRSILGTVKELYDSGNGLVGFLVIFFSVVVPVSKMLLMTAAAFFLKGDTSAGVLRFTSAVSKWSMADVFVVAVMVAFLAANASKDMDEVVALRAALEPGFYYFLGYCLFSVGSSRLLLRAEGSA